MPRLAAASVALGFLDGGLMAGGLQRRASALEGGVIRASGCILLAAAKIGPQRLLQPFLAAAPPAFSAIARAQESLPDHAAAPADPRGRKTGASPACHLVPHMAKAPPPEGPAPSTGRPGRGLLR
jgi:hypothetical protein